MVNQVSFTITATETAAVSTQYSSQSQQTITISKTYSNIQPRNIIAANNIANLACASATADSVTCTPLNTNGELQPDPVALSTITW